MGAADKAMVEKTIRTMKKKQTSVLLLFLSPFITGCSSVLNLDKLAESSAIIAFSMMLVYLGFVKVLPKFHMWHVPRVVFDYFIIKLSIIVVVSMIVLGVFFLGVFFLFEDKRFSLLISLNLFISSAYLLKLRHNYRDKSVAEIMEDKKSWFITLGTLFILLFLYFDGLEYVIG